MHTNISTDHGRSGFPRPTLLRSSWLLLFPLIASLLWVGAAPSHAAGESWSITDVNASGCKAGDWDLDVHWAGFVPLGTYLWHTRVVSDGKVYMNEGFLDGRLTSSGDDTWSLYSDFTYGPVDNPGTYPITPGKPMKVVITLENPPGSVISSWTMVAASCDSTALLYNGPTAADLDEDFVKVPQDLCPTLTAFRTNGCPLRDRTLSLRARYGPKRVVGKLVAAGYSALSAGRTVTIWKARPGPDRKVAVRTADSLGKFRARVTKGRYYATAPGLLVPSVGQVSADRSTTVRVR
jgi:hypothetical protein